ncbi:MAG TPA: hypothetical protein VHA11_07070 [Bryobacteraceae bacterium]|nr:hypothetical protein [Bryobacteraceae bacterium]
MDAPWRLPSGQSLAEFALTAGLDGIPESAAGAARRRGLEKS